MPKSLETIKAEVDAAVAAELKVASDPSNKGYVDPDRGNCVNLYATPERQALLRNAVARGRVTDQYTKALKSAVNEGKLDEFKDAVQALCYMRQHIVVDVEQNIWPLKFSTPWGTSFNPESSDAAVFLVDQITRCCSIKKSYLTSPEWEAHQGMLDYLNELGFAPFLKKAVEFRDWWGDCSYRDGVAAEYIAKLVPPKTDAPVSAAALMSKMAVVTNPTNDAKKNEPKKDALEVKAGSAAPAGCLIT